jgi:hypothetical protein
MGNPKKFSRASRNLAEVQLLPFILFNTRLEGPTFLNMSHEIDLQERLDLITRRIPLENLYGVEYIKLAFEAEGKRPRCLWGE